MTSDWDDSGQLRYLADWNCRLVRGDGRVARPGVVDVDGEEIPYDKLVVATGSRPAIPPVEGIDEVEYWTNREATRTHQVPESLVVLGGGPVGCELAQFYARMGAKVTIVERGEALLGRIHSDAGAVLADVFREEGIDVRLGVGVEKVAEGIRVHLSDGDRDREPAAARRDRPPPERRRARPRAARRRDHAARDRRRRPAPRGRRRLGDRRRQRHRALHARREVPGARRGGRPLPAACGRRLPSDPRGRLHRSRGGDRREDGRRRPRDSAHRARLGAAAVDVREAGAAGLPAPLRRSRGRRSSSAPSASARRRRSGSAS